MLAVKVSQTVSDYVQQISMSAVKVESIRADGTGEVGAGFYVAPNTLVTCAHVIGFTQQTPNPQVQTIKITGEDNSTLSGRVIDFDISLDVCIVAVQSPVKTYFLNLGNSGTVREGEAVITIGSPLGYTNSTSHGVVSKRYANNNNYFLLDIRTNPGNSGGLIYSIEKQAVIGICVAVYNSTDMQSEGISVGISIDSVKRLLKKNKIKFTYHEKH